MLNLCDLKKEPEINYPLFWDYKVIFLAEFDAKIYFERILSGKKEGEFRFTRGKKSANGKYQSYLLSVFVSSNAERLALFEELKNSAVFVL